MVKEPNSATQVKKKRKSAPEAEAEQDMYQRLCEYEEKEAKSRNLNEDSKVFLELTEEIRSHLSELWTLKTSEKRDAHTSESLENNISNILVKICHIKKINRMGKLNQVAERENLNIDRQKCDSIKLNYQNLVYELYHLSCETNKCLAFKSEDENIELVSLEDFMKDAPEAMTSKFKNFDPSNQEQAHALRLARLEWELTQRKALAEECKLLEEKQKKIVSEIKERKEKLKELLPLLNMVVKATRPLQEHLGLSMDGTRKDDTLASLLPVPLYILYANIVAYNNAFETNFNVGIIGDKDDATQFNEAQEVSKSTGLNEDDSEPESDLPEVDEVVEVKKKRHRKSTQQVNPLEEKKKKLLELHPLKVELYFAGDQGLKLSVVFSYYTKLKVVTVNSKVQVPSEITANTAKEILAGHNVLNELRDNDTGLESPNPSNWYLLKKMGLGSFQTLIPDIGYAYRWAQSVCGINFLTSKKFSDDFSKQSVQAVLGILKKRLINRMHLARQMQQLELCEMASIPESIPAPKNAVSALSKWSSSTYQAFCQAKFTRPLVEEEFVSDSDLFYVAKIARNSVNLQAFVVIKDTYPTSSPLFALNFTYKGTQYNSLTCDDIRDMERNLNVNFDFGIKRESCLLLLQMAHLCSYFDIFLETLDSKVFSTNATFLRRFGGRNRRRPFTYKAMGTGIFTQY